ncbi:MAG: hypothetical protein MR517_06425 [Bacteroidales bacterium]|nr:hypothetical protein [Bacteroidales bacterium]
MSPHVILIDAEYLDRVAFDLTVNFETMLGRRLPKADLARWLDCIALDGGLREGDNEVQAVFIHPREMKEFRYFTPGNFACQLDGKAFKDHIAEFTMASCPIERVTTFNDFFKESLEALLLDKDIESLMVVADFDGTSDVSRRVTANVKELCATPPQPKNQDGSPMTDANGIRILLPRKDITLFTMAPMSGRGFNQEILGYSLMSALGISAGEIQG